MLSDGLTSSAPFFSHRIINLPVLCSGGDEACMTQLARQGLQAGARSCAVQGKPLPVPYRTYSSRTLCSEASRHSETHAAALHSTQLVLHVQRFIPALSISRALSEKQGAPETGIPYAQASRCLQIQHV